VRNRMLDEVMGDIMSNLDEANAKVTGIKYSQEVESPSYLEINFNFIT
jgi:hypothetical protein